MLSPTETPKTDQRCRETRSLLWTRATSAEVPPKVQLGLCLIVAALHFGAFWLRGSGLMWIHRLHILDCSIYGVG